MCCKKLIIFSSCLVLSTLMVCLHLTAPFYVSSDMDLITLIDMLSMNAGQLPIHLNHTGAGMFFLLYWMERIFDLFSLSPGVTYADLQNSLEPMLVVANKVTFLRWINLAVLVSTAVFLLSALYQIHKGTLFLLSGILLCFSVQGFWGYNLHTVRTETFSLFFFAMALALTAHEFFDKKKSFANYILILVGLSLSYITKIQALLVVGAVFTVVVFFYPKEVLPKKFSSVRTYRWALVCYLIISAISLIVSVDAHTSSRGYFFNQTLGLPLLLSLIFCSLRKSPTQHRFLDRIRCYLTPHLFMLFAALCLAIVVTSTTTHSIGGFFYHIISYFKLVFLRFSVMYDMPFTEYFMQRHDLLWVLRQYGVYLVMASILAAINIYHFCQSRNIKSMACYILVFSLLLFNATLATRSMLRDTIWNHIFFAAFILVSLRILLMLPYRRRFKKSVNCMVLVASAFIFYKNVFVFQMPHPFRYDYDTFFETRYYNYIERSAPYTETMAQSYPNPEKKRSLKRKLLRPFRHALSLKTHFPGGEFSIFDVSIPHGGSFLVREPDGGKSLRKGCPSSICDETSFVVSSTKQGGVVKITPKNDTEIYVVRDTQTEDTQCHELALEGEGMFFYKARCYQYKIDDGHRAFVVLENT